MKLGKGLISNQDFHSVQDDSYFV